MLWLNHHRFCMSTIAYFFIGYWHCLWFNFFRTLLHRYWLKIMANAFSEIFLLTYLLRSDTLLFQVVIALERAKFNPVINCDI